ncbi:hypothetical protein CW751_02360 [Brumimicrobium salinarum]|uniref:PKD domain-containing protein n=1 Tax=Brumimicrobium salinarum TaxID=2058658 RepID=A0A2I0R6K0_9FLAO|nr:M43 family zinc metalloprotease [Brumimicrobium salinarum]PKR82194.1 hypothetical protein CW751_02360 [Brumimicrobium salinarum]
MLYRSKTAEYIESLSPEERLQYKQNEQEKALQIENFIAQNPELLQASNSRGAITYTIPVVFHIIHQNGPENISDEQVLNALNHMNEDFQKSNPGWPNVQPEFLPIVADVEVEFKLAKKDNLGNCTSGITRTNSAVTDGGTGAQRVQAVQAVHGNWPGDKYLNIFVFKTMDVQGAAGYTFRPDPWRSNSMDNGIHLIHNYVGSIGTAGSQGAHTLSHEAGHWLDLPHPWGNSNDPGLASNCNGDDNIADTPNTIGWRTCNLRGESCGSLDNVENFMEYSYCSKMFTNDQKARMHGALNISNTGRLNVHSASNLISTGVNSPDVLCEANFGANYREVCVGQEVTFTDYSYNLVTSRNWEFQGGSPATSTAESPTVTYDTPGLYEVKLTASDGSSSVSETKPSYIKVLPAGQSLPFTEGFENITSLSNSDWLVDNNSGAGFELTSDAAFTGNNSVYLRNFGQPRDNIDALISSPIDLSSITSSEGVTLSFRYAYRRRSSSNYERLTVLLSQNCGESWLVRKSLVGHNLGTETAGSNWAPDSKDDWVTVHMTNVTSSFWIDNFRFKFEFESDGGNNIYLDDINIFAGPKENDPLNIDEESFVRSFNVYPNPASDVANVSFNINDSKLVQIDLVNIMGQKISTNKIQSNVGQNLVMIDTEGVEAGVYLININVDGVKKTKRIVIE